MAGAGRKRTFDVSRREALSNWLANQLGAERVHIVAANVLDGGAIQENWRLEVEIVGGRREGRHSWVLRTDAVSRLSLSHDRGREFAVLTAAHGAGICVPEPVLRCADRAVIGAPFMISERVNGTARPREIIPSGAVAAHGEELARQLGQMLARIHAIDPEKAGLGFLPRPPAPPARFRVSIFRACLEEVSEPRPALEYILTWLDRNAPTGIEIVLCHGDYRTGNYMVDLTRDAALTGILDWEFAHLGDRHEDVGYLTAPCWRFGGDMGDPRCVVGGVGGIEAFAAGYREVGGDVLRADQFAYWQVMACAKWATIALMQAERHLGGQERSLELLLTGLMAPQMEYDALCIIQHLEGDPIANRSVEARRKQDKNTDGDTGRQRAAMLVDSALEHFETEIYGTIGRENRYGAAMLRNALAIAGRKLADPSHESAPHLRDAIEAGADLNLAEIANLLRTGGVRAIDGTRLRSALMADVEADLQVRYPKFLAERAR